MPKKLQKRDVQLLFEAGCVRFIRRSWEQFLGPNFANLAEHHFRVCWVALLLAEMEGVRDTGKVLKMALVHDLTESRTGDVHYISRQYTGRDELKALDDIFSKTLIGPEYQKLWREYHEQKTREAKIVKDADFLDADLELAEQRAKGISFVKVWQGNRKKMPKIFYTASAKAVQKAIWSSDPLAWIRGARSRFNDKDGDFRKKLAKKKSG